MGQENTLFRKLYRTRINTGAYLCPGLPLTPDLKPFERFVLAIRKELQAIGMYTRLTDMAEDATEKTLFMELAGGNAVTSSGSIISMLTLGSRVRE